VLPPAPHPFLRVPWRAGAGRNINCRVSRPPRFSLAIALIAVCWTAGASAGNEPSARPESAQRSLRVVSMNPSLTRMLIALGAQQVLVGVDEYSADHEPAVAALPRVGGLFNPSLEAVLALEPDLVVVVPSVQQRDFRARLRLW